MPSPGKAGDEERERAMRAVEADYQFHRGWATDEWCYVGVVVELVTEFDCPKAGSSVWGIESIADAYLTDAARECAEEIISELPRKLDNVEAGITDLRAKLVKR